MKIAVIGLGKMGSQIVERLVEDDHQVFVVARHQAEAELATRLGAKPFLQRTELVQSFGDQPPIIWLMIPHTNVSAEISIWLDLLPVHSFLIDGGNTDFRRSQEHAQQAANKQINFIDIGVSGGVMGRDNGFSMMIGSSESTCQAIIPALNALAKPRGGYAFFNHPGSGHYVKMIHNAIEYGMMQSLAEGYRMLKEGSYPDLDLAKAGQVWQQSSVIKSTLNQLATQVMTEDQDLSLIDGQVAESGETRWTLEVAKEIGIELPAIQSAFQVRLASQEGTTNYATKILAALRHKFGGHSLNPTRKDI